MLYACPLCNGTIDTEVTPDFLKDNEKGIYHIDCDKAEAERMGGAVDSFLETSPSSLEEEVGGETQETDVEAQEAEAETPPPEPVPEGADADFEEPVKVKSKAK